MQKQGNLVNRLKVYYQHQERAKLANAPAKSVKKAPVQQEPELMPATQQIMAEQIATEQNRIQNQKANRKNIAVAFTEPVTPAKLLKQQREELAIFEEMQKQKILNKHLNQVLKTLLPKEQRSNEENSYYLTPEILQGLEKIYLGIPEEKRISLARLLSNTTYTAPMQDFQGGFVDVNADKAQRIMGNLTTQVENF